ncbi:MAG TPA: hypothetical protein VIJ90_10450 [Gemmatimonadaceae bacterium]
MRSHAELRRAAEWLLRAALFAALGIALWRSLQHEGRASGSRSTSTSALARDLDAIISDPAVVAIDLAIDAMPSRAERDVLVALRRAGVTVRWRGTPPALAVEATRVREPDERARILVGAGTSTPISLVDSAGLLGTVRARTGATIEAATIVGAVRAQQGKFAARAVAPVGEPRRAVLVLGRADWESKFVMSALVESGWVVRASIPTAPGVTVRDDGVLPIDTARYDVVVALDSSAADMAPAIARFVAQGGGLIAAGSALALAPLRAIAPARAGDRLPGRILLADDSVTPRDLPLRPFSAMRPDAVTLERQAAGPALAARRAGMGRVLAVGYDESWRWRMLGGATGLAAHRRWWSGAAGSVAPERSGAIPRGGDASPLASLVSALGAPSTSVASNNQPARNPLPLILMILVAACLLAETASRRFRGAR